MGISTFWNDKKVLVTGGSGFLGRQITRRLAEAGARVIAPKKAQYDLIHFEQAIGCVSEARPDVVIHSAAYYGGLGITIAEPGRIFFENLVMGANLMEASRRYHVGKVVTIGTACAYPGHLESGMKETELWSGPLHDTVVSYGSVKKMLAIQGLAYRKQYDFNSIHLIPANLYGPNDCFDEYRSHVVGALIRKFVEAYRRNESVSIWGTGTPVREFLYVEDCADGVLRAAEHYEDTLPLNLGTGVGTTIRELVLTIAEALNFRGEIRWDKQKPDGQKAKTLDISRMKERLHWTPPTALAAGLKKTLEWYQQNY
jgi:GDP-L-fucose synthase